jgi:hypothetical protein
LSDKQIKFILAIPQVLKNDSALQHHLDHEKLYTTMGYVGISDQFFKRNTTKLSEKSIRFGAWTSMSPSCKLPNNGYNHQ